MTPQIKNRIEQIRRREVPEGYKRTKVGIVPVDWNVDVLGNFISECKVLSNDIEKYPVYSSSRQGLIPQSQYYDNREATETNLGYKIVPKGYVTYRHMSDDDIFHFNINDTESDILVSSEYPVFTTGKQGCLGYIIPLLNEMPRFRHFCRMQKMGGTRTRLYFKNLCAFQSAFPPLAEQKKIAEILTAQDRVIALLDQKIEQLQKMKKVFLQKMFPAKGQTVPEWRFKGFTAPWERRKLGDILQTLPFKAYLKSPEQDGKYEIIQQGNAPIIGYANGEPCKDYENTVIFGDHTLSLYKPKTPFFVATDGVRIVKGFDNMDGNYLLHLLERNKPQSEGYKRYYSILADIDVFFTENHEQQKKIGDYFHSLDNLITLHQRKRDEEKQKKKALMQLLLTGIVRTV